MLHLRGADLLCHLHRATDKIRPPRLTLLYNTQVQRRCMPHRTFGGVEAIGRDRTAGVVKVKIWRLSIQTSTKFEATFSLFRHTNRSGIKKVGSSTWQHSLETSKWRLSTPRRCS